MGAEERPGGTQRRRPDAGLRAGLSACVDLFRTGSEPRPRLVPKRARPSRPAAKCSLAIKSDGSLWAWGRSDYGQVGSGINADHPDPTRIGATSDWATVAAGRDHSLALKTDGSLWAWGNNCTANWATAPPIGRNAPAPRRHGQRLGGRGRGRQSFPGPQVRRLAVGLGTTTGPASSATAHDRPARFPPASERSNDWVAVAGGRRHPWLSSPTARSGPGARTRTVSWATAPPPTARFPPASGRRTIGWRWPGATTTPWPSSPTAPSGPGGTTATANWATAPPPTDTPPPASAPEPDWATVARGAIHSLAVRTDGSLWAWGSNNWGQLGDGTDHRAPRSHPDRRGTDLGGRIAGRRRAHSLALGAGGALLGLGARTPTAKWATAYHRKVETLPCRYVHRHQAPQPRRHDHDHDLDEHHDVLQRRLSSTTTTVPRSGAVTFSDVAGSPYPTAIDDLAAEGIITGFHDGTFRPNDSGDPPAVRQDDREDPGSTR